MAKFERQQLTVMAVLKEQATVSFMLSLFSRMCHHTLFCGKNSQAGLGRKNSSSSFRHLVRAKEAGAEEEEDVFSVPQDGAIPECCGATASIGPKEQRQWVGIPRADRSCGPKSLEGKPLGGLEKFLC